MAYQNQFLFALVFAVLVETGALFVLLKAILKVPGITNLQIAYAGLLATASSLPYFWFVLPAYLSNFVVYLVVGETLVVLWEAVLYWMLLRVKFLTALLLSVVANALSLGLGALVFRHHS